MKKILIKNYEHFLPGKDRDGGGYIFGRQYAFHDGEWRMSHFSFSDFEFCGVLGIFSRCSDCRWADTCSGDVEVTTQDVLKDILGSIGKENLSVSVVLVDGRDYEITEGAVRLLQEVKREEI